ncbi:MAG: response regulator transcription factor [Haliea sp.]|nr:response regulator transcription factor [Haliea sp.]MDP5065029.1 response regulator transcription factor [Haliea sp.]
MHPHLLIIDDDRELCELLGEYLQSDGFTVTSCQDGAGAIAQARATTYDAIVLDVMLPGVQGLEVLRRLRAEHIETPVLMLTARGEEIDRIVGLELGADDYLAKPCNPRELAARLRAILRRAGSVGGSTAALDIDIGFTAINAAERSATWQSRDLQLTSVEFNVLQVLLKHAGSVVDKELLSQQALGRALTAYDRSVDVHVSKIRRKFLACGANNPIVSIRGSGYQFLVHEGDNP